MIVSVVVAEALMVLLLWTALTRSMSRIIRPLIACVAVSLAWGAWVLPLVVHAPWWFTAVTGGFFLISAACLGVSIHLATREDSDQAGGGEEPGGSRRLAPEGPRGGGGEPQPEWWPEFERELASYASQQEPAEPARQPVEC